MEKLQLAVGALGDVFEPPTFWSSIANSDDYAAQHRRLAVYQLFRRHVRAGQTLSELSEILDGPTWLMESNVVLVDRIHGKIPFKWDLDNSVFAIRLGLPADNNSTIYLKLAGKQIDAESLFKLLRAPSFDKRLGEVMVLEIGYSEID